jgi:glutamine cyclotransferase
MLRSFCLAAIALCATACTPQPPAGPCPDAVLPCTGACSYCVVESFPHDRAAFTQGLVYEDGYLYEGTGLEGRSTLRKVEIATGSVVKSIPLEKQFFGEGITIFGERIIQLTWQSHVGFVYDKTTFEKLREFTYPTEGWGLTHDGASLIMSDGSDTLFFLDPETFTETRRVQVTQAGKPQRNLNELEFIKGRIFANIWQTDRIVCIDPATGEITGQINLTGLLPFSDRIPPVDVLNGIAYDSEEDRLFITGKLWPKLFHIDLVQAGK